MIDRMIEKAKKARKNAYAPYSKFKVGAALLCENGKIYTGANCENASFGATICAERSALISAISEGERNFTAIVVVAGKTATPPCGICLQMLSEFADIDVYYADFDGGNIRHNKLSELMPIKFDKENLE